MKRKRFYRRGRREREAFKKISAEKYFSAILCGDSFFVISS